MTVATQDQQDHCHRIPTAGLASSRRGRAALAAGAAVLLALAGCRKPPAEVPVVRPAIVGVVHFETRGTGVQLPGTVEARDVTPLSFRVAGKVVERTVRLGDRVRAGQVVARLDPQDLRRQQASARADLQAAEQRLATARVQLDRDRAQLGEHLISPQQFDQTRDAYASALAQRDSAREQAGLAGSQLGYATLTADRAGVITAEQADTGQNVAAGTPIYQLAWSGALDVVSDLPESALGRLSPGARAWVTLTALPQRRFAATLRELAPAADPASRTYRARLTLDLTQPGADAMRMGMTATVAFQAPADASAHSATLPASALFHEGDRTAVWVVRPGSDQLELRPVQVTGYGDATITVADGLQDGERVLLRGVHAVSAGEKVAPTTPLRPEDARP